MLEEGLLMGRRLSLVLLLVLGVACQGAHDGGGHHEGDTSHEASGTEAAAGDLASLGIKNMRTPAEGLVTGGQLTEEQMVALMERGYATFINLRPAMEYEPAWEEAFAQENGISFIRIPVQGAAGITRENADLLAQAMSTAESGAVVYCASGNRVGALLALKAHYVDGLDAESALQFGLDAGVTRLEPMVREMLGLAEGEEPS
jgi:uncharacterized protein (TIGR01244 family)